MIRVYSSPKNVESSFRPSPLNTVNRQGCTMPWVGAQVALPRMRSTISLCTSRSVRSFGYIVRRWRISSVISLTLNFMAIAFGATKRRDQMEWIRDRQLAHLLSRPSTLSTSSPLHFFHSGSVPVLGRVIPSAARKLEKHDNSFLDRFFSTLLLASATAQPTLNLANNGPVPVITPYDVSTYGAATETYGPGEPGASSIYSFARPLNGATTHSIL